MCGHYYIIYNSCNEIKLSEIAYLLQNEILPNHQCLDLSPRLQKLGWEDKSSGDNAFIIPFVV